MSFVRPIGKLDRPSLRARLDVGPFLQGVARRFAIVTPLGWGLVAAGIAAWILGARLGWEELELIAAACFALLVLCTLFTIGRAELAIDVHLQPARLVVGETATGEIRVRNVSGRRLLPLPVELPVGKALARFDIPSLAGGREITETFMIPTNRRDVIPIGPATSVRGDPLGVLRREVKFSDLTELFIHPHTTRLDSLGSGFLRDLEGNATDAISVSDLAFHSLRGYVAGDDRRHIHWRTTARMASGNLMVRQFLDTRRSHLVVVLDGAAGGYADEDEFELAVSAGASLAVRAVRDDQEVSVVPGERLVSKGGGMRILDAFSRAQLTPEAPPLVELAGRASEACRDASIVVLVAGSLAELEALRRAASRFDLDAKVLALVANPGRPSSVQTGGGLTVMSIATLGDLAAVVRGAFAS